MPRSDGGSAVLSFRNLHRYPAGRPLSADDLLEFHAARVLLLLHLCGEGGAIQGLTKLAKLDFFARYPTFFARACVHLHRPAPPADAMTDAVEGSMVRHHYGPWDHRYYHVLSYLEATGAIRVTKVGAAYHFHLTDVGSSAAARLAERDAYVPLREHMRRVRKELGRRTGDSLKNLIYTLFRAEVAQRPLGEVIR